MRAYCNTCGYPRRTCLCACVEACHAPATILILQHHREASHAKNTARLVTLGLKNASVVSGKSPDDFAHVKAHINPANSALIYPGQASRPLEGDDFAAALPQTLLFLDGSWRQTFALYSQLSWLSSLPQWSFDHAPDSNYTIRHTAQPASLSTLEAVAYSLSAGYHFDTRSLLRLQTSMQSNWQGPAHHRR